MKLKYLIVIALTLLCVQNIQAQVEADPDTGTSVPIDGGIVTVTLLAAAYGAKRRQEKKDKED